MSALTNTSKYDRLSNNLSNSTMSLNSPNRDINSNVKNRSSEESESDDDEDEEDEDASSKTTEETTESEVSRDTKDTKQSTKNQSSSFCEDDEAVEIRPVKAIPRKRSGLKPEPEKRNVPEQRPVPQVRFSKLINHMKK